MRRDKEMKQIALRVSIALSAGVFSMMPAVSAAPVLNKVVSGDAKVDQVTTPQVTDITSEKLNNVIDWKDFSVSQGETVRFDEGKKEHNYLNIVSGANTSQIDGSIQGGKDVYIVNPHGVIFGNTASVDVGSLQVSTRPISEADYTNINDKADMQPLKNTASSLAGDVVNMGTVQAETVFIEGKNVKFMDVSEIRKKTENGSVVNNDVTINAENIRLGQRPNTSGLLKSAAKSAGSGSYTLNSSANISSFTSIHNQTELASINNKLNGDYELANSFSVSNYVPIGGNSYGAFTGKFNGNYYTISGISTTGRTYAGLFGRTNGATITNVGVKSGNVSAMYAGGIAGYAENTTFKDVYNEGVSVSFVYDDNDNGAGGGIVGYASGSSITSAYNTGNVISDSSAGGILGYSHKTTIAQTYNTGSTENGIVGSSSSTAGSSISNSYITGSKVASSYYKGAGAKDVVKNSSNKASDYTGLSGLGDGDGKDTVWRIYEGYTKPLLVNFLKAHGTVNVNYDYEQGNNTGNNGGDDLTVIYNHNNINISNVTYTGADNINKNLITQVSTSVNGNVKLDSSNKPLKQTIFYTGQQGYYLVGNHLTINQRTVDISSDLGDTHHITKVYDGTADASKAAGSLFESVDSTGIIPGDDTVTIDTSGITANFLDSKTGENDAADAGANKDVKISGTLNLNNKSGYYNYKLSNTTVTLKEQTIHGNSITQKPIVVSLKNSTGIDKDYDGKTTVTGASYIPSATQIIWGAGVSTTTDNSNAQTLTLSYDKDANYVDAKDKATKMAGTYTNQVKYGGIKISGVSNNGKSKNYKLVDASGKTIYSEAVDGLTGTGVNQSTGGALYGSGKISPKNIASTGFYWYKDGEKQTATREYDGKTSYTAPKTYTVSNAGSDTGMIAGDSLTFTVQGADFVTSDTGTLNANKERTAATTKNVKDAKGVLYTVKIAGESASNYTLDGATIDTNGTNTVIGPGTITPRTLNVIANSSSYVEKIYDGTDVVKDSKGNTTFSFPGYLQYADPTDTAHHLLGDTDKSTISITGVYVKTGNDASGKDVNYTQSTTSDANAGETVVSYSPADKNITYTAKVLENGQVSENYIFSTSKDTTATFAGKGRIKPATITGVTFAKATKTYDGTKDVTNTVNTSAPLLTNDRITINSVTGSVNNEAINTIFDVDSSGQLAEGSQILTGKYGTLSGGVFEENENVQRPGGSVVDNKVAYTGLGNLLKTRNYILADSINTVVYGDGRINPLEITDSSWIKLDRNDKAITKVYDGNNNVAYGTVKATDYLTDKKAYIQPDDSDNKIDITLDVAGATYKTQHSDNSQAQDVTYKLSVSETGNYTIANSLKPDGYVLKTITNGGKITPKAITITDALLVDNNTDSTDGQITKVYDATPNISEKGESLITINNQLLTDMDSTYKPTNGITAEFNDKDAGSKTVNYTLKLTGDSHNDYYFRNADKDAAIDKWTSTGTIQKRTLSLSTAVIPPKIYDTKSDVKAAEMPKRTTIDFGKDSTDNKDNNAVVALDGFVDSSLKGTYGYGSNDTDFQENGDVYRVNGTPSNKDVKYSGVLAALGDNAKNYEVADTFYGKGIIKPSTITQNDFVFELYDNITQVYSGSNIVGEYGMDKDERDKFQRKWIDNTKTGINTPSGFVNNSNTNSPAFKFEIKSAEFDTADVGPDKTVTYTIEVKDSDLGNYEYTGPATFSLSDTITSGSITARPVTATVVHDTLTKYYDGGTDLYNGDNKAFSTDTATGTVLSKGDIINLDGLIKDKNGNVIGANASKGEYVTADVGVGNKSIEYTPAISGAGNNYKIVDSKGHELTDGKIITTENTIKPFGVLLTVSSTPVTKEYDGTTSVAADKAREALQLGTNYDGLTNADLSGITDETGVYYNAANTEEDSNVNPDDDHKPGTHVVRYTGLGISNNNYYLSDENGKKITAINGTGIIKPYKLQGDYKFEIGDITKEYDKNTKLAYTGGDYYRDYSEEAVKNYLTAPKVEANGKEVPLVFSLDLNKTKYQGDGAIGSYTADLRLGISNENYNYSFEDITINEQSADGGLENSSYYFNLTKDNATITPRRVYVALADEPVITKVYDGNDKVINDTVAKVIVPDAASDFLQGDDVSLDKDKISAVYADKNAGMNKDVTYSVALQGADKGNYVLYLKNDGTELTAANPLMGKGDITKAKLTFAPETLDKTYDGNANITFTADDLHLTGITYKDDNGQTVTEKVVLTADAFAKVKGEYGTGNSASDFTADGNVKRNGDAVVSKDILYTGLQEALAVMADDEIAKNYEIDSDEAFFASKGTIKPILLDTLKAKWQADTDKTYDATPDVLESAGSMQLFTTATLTNTPIEVSYKGTDSGVYVDDAGNAIKDVGNHGLKYTVTEVTKNLGNYQLTDAAAKSAVRDWLSTTARDNIDGLAVTGEITPLTLNVVAKDGFHKIYDGTTDIADSEVTARIDLDETGKAVLQKDSDDVSYEVAAAYDTSDANVAPGVIKNLKDINYSLTLKGNTKGNYILQGAVNDAVTGNDVYANTAKLGDIEQRKVYVDVVDVDGIDKTYDTTRAMPKDYTSEGRFALRATDETTGIVDNEDAKLDFAAIQGEYTSEHVQLDADGKPAAQQITFNNFQLTGSANLGNYVVETAELTGSGTISPAPLTVAIKAAPTKVYDGESSFVDLDNVVGDTYTANKNLEVNGWLQDSDKTSANVLLSDIGYDDAEAGINKGYGYKVSQSNTDYVLTQGEKMPSIEVTDHGQTGTVTANDGTITPRTLTIDNISSMTKEYDGTEAGTANAEANITLGNYINKDKDNLGLTATAVYHGANAGISEDSDELENHKVTYTLSLSNKNYQLEDSVVDGTGTISRKGLTVVATPVTVNNGEAMPEFSGTVEGLVDKDSSLADLYTFAPLATTTTNIPGSFKVYGWYNDRISGNLGLNYTFVQDAGNETAFTVNYVNTNNGNPDTKITPSSDVYNQISKDMSSGFGDNGAAAIEYRDKSGNVIATETIDSGEIHDSGTMSDANGDLTNQDTKLANIGIVGGDIVNTEGADAASTADIQVSGDGTVINLEVVSVQKEENEDKIEAQDKESEIAIESSDKKDEDEIELKIEGEGVNVA
ncbi:filamentous hemagglutinin family N-terminal domain-containing protein [Selenomonas ruminantium]|uniref:Filamentous hemagglutinin family N-terminal domain-containing protein n=2 Tax=Selenomonas ruminantium TaxID=971 RepID=A0A1H0RGU7_SELRU|nr:filamentous hemagglutinin family N-terminal domain-containing protein [Selenomonas ruminantium]